MDLHEQSKTDSNRREERLMTHLEKTTTELTTITHTVGDIQKEMVRMNDAWKKSKKENNMQQITEIITNGAVSILVILAGVAVKAVKDYLVQKGGEKTIKIVEILAKNAVNAVEQVASETGFKGEEKLEQARTKIRAELTKYNISMTDKDLDTFVESAVKQMNDAWKGQE